MNKKMHVRKGDQVIVLSGADKNKKGKVLKVFPSEGKVIVEGLNMVKKHQKPRKQGDVGGIVNQPAPMYAAKVMHLCGKCGKPTRLSRILLDDGKRVRVCKHCGEPFND